MMPNGIGDCLVFALWPFKSSIQALAAHIQRFPWVRGLFADSRAEECMGQHQSRAKRVLHQFGDSFEHLL